jgi:hypothetical protein
MQTQCSSSCLGCTDAEEALVGGVESLILNLLLWAICAFTLKKKVIKDVYLFKSTSDAIIPSVSTANKACSDLGLNCSLFSRERFKCMEISISINSAAK